MQQDVEVVSSGFTKLGLDAALLDCLDAAGFVQPTAIQSKAIPTILDGRDLIGIAQTGTGKTAAFALPLLQRLRRGRARARMPRSLILEPTRELAAQVEENLSTFDPEARFSRALLIGGTAFDEQFRKLARGVDILIATPGRLLDHFERGKLLLTGVEYFVIDEADRMLDLGFIDDIKRIGRLLPMRRQTLLFSATMPAEIEKLAARFMEQAERVEASPPATTAKTINQRYVLAPLEPMRKRAELRRLFGALSDLKNAIVFCNRKRDAAILATSLSQHGFSAAPLHGDLEQSQRMETLDAFRSGHITLLVASDVAARGLDIPEVSHVINFDVPFRADDYVHRIGRTGRAGRHGEAFSLVTTDDELNWRRIETLIGKRIEAFVPDRKPITPKANSQRRPRTEVGAKLQRNSPETQRNSPETQRNSPGTQRNSPGTQRTSLETQRTSLETQRTSLETKPTASSEKRTSKLRPVRERLYEEKSLVTGFGDKAIPDFMRASARPLN